MFQTNMVQPIYSKNPSNNEGYYEYRTNKGLLVVTAVGKKNQGYVTRVSMTYNEANGPTYNQVKKSLAKMQWHEFNIIK